MPRMDAVNLPTTSVAFSGGSVSASIIVLRLPSTTRGYVEAPAPTMRLRKSSGRGERRKEYGWRSDVKANGVDRREPERVDRPRDELAHLPRSEQIVAALRLSEARKVDREHLEVSRQPGPDGDEGENALRPGTEEHDLLVAGALRRVTDLESIDGPPRDVERLLLLNVSLIHGTTAPSLRGPPSRAHRWSVRVPTNPSHPEPPPSTAPTCASSALDRWRPSR